jgi:outer membrane protein assembly factor BamE
MLTRYFRPLGLLLLLTGTTLLGGCGAASSYIFPGVYKIDIAQGNIITQKQVDQLRPGLNKRQVTFILGTPMVRDTFDQNRWDYLYSYQHGGGERVQEHLTVFFKDDKLVRIEGDFQQTPENLQFPTASATPATKTQ